jgi:hypothetical protein
MRVLVVLLIACVGVPTVHAQWSDDPADNLVVADRTGPQVQPKIVATADGGFYVSWFDSSTGGYDVYLQRLDAEGVEQWPHNGVLVADRGYSSTQDYGLSIDTAGNALLAFRDDRFGADQITVAKVASDGSLLWGTNGVQVSSGSAYVAVPKVAGTTDGNVVAAWTSNSNVMAQKLDPDGAALWGAGVTLSPAGGSFTLCDLRATVAGQVILSFTVGDFPGPFHLWAQKLASADGALMWGSGHVQVYDQPGGSLQIGNRPSFITDGQGGAVFAWYTSTPSLQCRVQRIFINGAEAFPHQGVEVSTNATRLRVSPSAAFLPDESIAVFWTELDSTQSLSGVYGQRILFGGTRDWTDSGRELMPLSADQVMAVVTLPWGDGAVVAWIHSVGFGDDPVYAVRVDGSGDFVWTPPITDVAISPTDSSRLVGAPSTDGFVAYAWNDGGFSDGDILAQNVNGDGSLGSLTIFEDGFESGDTSEWTVTVP